MSSSSSYPSLHVNELGNVLKGPPLPIPRVINGVLAPTMGAGVPYVNPVGNESQIPSPPSGLRTLMMARGGDLDNPEAQRNAVDQGSAFGHVLNDDEGELDASQLNGINQIPAQAVFNFMYQPFTGEGSLFTTQSAPPPGAPLSAAAAAARMASGREKPRIPGVGGVGPKASEYNRGPHNNYRNEKGRSVSIYDEESSAAARDSRAHRTSFTTSASLTKARLLAGSGVGNPLENVNPQAQKVMMGVHHGGVAKGRGHKKRLPQKRY